MTTFFDLHVQCRIVLKFSFRVVVFFFCFVVVICDLVHDVETIFPALTTNSNWKSFRAI